MIDLIDIIKKFEKEGISANLKKASREGRALFIEGGQVSCESWDGHPGISSMPYRSMHFIKGRFSYKLWEYKEAKQTVDDGYGGSVLNTVAWWYVRIHHE